MSKSEKKRKKILKKAYDKIIHTYANACEEVGPDYALEVGLELTGKSSVLLLGLVEHDCLDKTENLIIDSVTDYLHSFKTFLNKKKIKE